MNSGDSSKFSGLKFYDSTIFFFGGGPAFWNKGSLTRGQSPSISLSPPHTQSQQWTLSQELKIKIKHFILIFHLHIWHPNSLYYSLWRILVCSESCSLGVESREQVTLWRGFLSGIQSSRDPVLAIFPPYNHTVQQESPNAGRVSLFMNMVCSSESPLRIAKAGNKYVFKPNYPDLVTERKCTVHFNTQNCTVLFCLC